MDTKPNPIATILVLVLFGMVSFYFTRIDEIFYFTISLGFIGLFSEKWRLKISTWWMQLSQLLSKIIPNILLTLIYILIVIPISGLSRLIRKDNPMIIDRNRISFFKSKKTTNTSQMFDKPW